jgi:hypothetical protein
MPGLAVIAELTVFSGRRPLVCNLLSEVLMGQVTARVRRCITVLAGFGPPAMSGRLRWARRFISSEHDLFLWKRSPVQEHGGRGLVQAGTNSARDACFVCGQARLRWATKKGGPVCTGPPLFNLDQRWSVDRFTLPVQPCKASSFSRNSSCSSASGLSVSPSSTGFIAGTPPRLLRNLPNKCSSA